MQHHKKTHWYGRIPSGLLASLKSLCTPRVLWTRSLTLREEEALTRDRKYTRQRQERDYRSPQRQRAIYVRAHTVCEKRAVGINAWKSEKRTQAERMCDEGCMRLRGVIENWSHSRCSTRRYCLWKYTPLIFALWGMINHCQNQAAGGVEGFLHFLV